MRLLDRVRITVGNMALWESLKDLWNVYMYVW